MTQQRKFKMEITDHGDFTPGGAYALMKHEDFDELWALVETLARQSRRQVPEFSFWSMTINRDDAYDA